MTIETANMIINAAALYFAIGIVLAILFLAFGVGRLDQSAKNASFFFKPMIFLGCVVIWPLLLIRILTFNQINKPLEDNE